MADNLNTNGVDDTERKRSVEGSGNEDRRVRSHVVPHTPVLSSRSADSHSAVEVIQPPVQAQGNANEQVKSIGMLVQELLLPNEETVKSAFIALDKMEFYRDENSKVREDVVGTGGCLAVVQSMRNHPNSIGVQSYGNKLLGNLAFKSEKNKTHIFDVGGVEVILLAMNTFPGSEPVQSFGSNVLRNLSFSSIHQNKIMGQYRESTISAMIIAMLQLPNTRKIQENGCVFLEKLASNSEDCKEFILSNRGIVECVLKAMKTFLGSEPVQRFGSFVLRTLSCNKVIEQEYQETVVLLMIEAMQKSPSNRLIQENGCIVLRNLASSSEECKEFIRKNVGPTTVAKVYEIHADMKKIVMDAMKAL